MHLGRKNTCYSYTMSGTPLMATKKEKDLGVIIVLDLKASEQVTKVEAAANSMLGRIKRTFTCMDKMFLPLYKMLLHPHMEHSPGLVPIPPKRHRCVGKGPEKSNKAHTDVSQPAASRTLSRASFEDSGGEKMQGRHNGSLQAGAHI